MANNQPAVEMLKCLDCGGLFFVKSIAQRYQKAGYGSAEFRSTDSMPKTVLQCIGCGALVPPKDQNFARNTVAQIQQDDFTKSVKAGETYRKSHSIQNVAHIAASPAEVEELRKLVEDIRKTVNAMNTPKSPQPKEAVAKAKTADTE